MWRPPLFFEWVSQKSADLNNFDALNSKEIWQLFMKLSTTVYVSAQ